MKRSAPETESAVASRGDQGLEGLREESEAENVSGDFGSGPSGLCDLCGRTVAELTKHHLIPQSRHRNKRNKKTFDRAEVKTRVAWLCRPCHHHVHATIDNKDLEDRYHTLALLAAHPELVKFKNWLRRKPDGSAVPTSRTSRSATASRGSRRR